MVYRFDSGPGHQFGECGMKPYERLCFDRAFFYFYFNKISPFIIKNLHFYEYDWL